MIEQVFPYQVEANDSLNTIEGSEIVFLVETFTNDTVLLRFKSGRKLVCYSKEILEVKKSHKSFSNCVKHDRQFNR